MNSTDLVRALIAALDLPPACTEAVVTMRPNQPVEVRCTYYPMEPGTDKMALEPVTGHFVLLPRDNEQGTAPQQER